MNRLSLLPLAVAGGMLFVLGAAIPSVSPAFSGERGVVLGHAPSSWVERSAPGPERCSGRLIHRGATGDSLAQQEPQGPHAGRHGPWRARVSRLMATALDGGPFAPLLWEAGAELVRMVLFMLFLHHLQPEALAIQSESAVDHHPFLRSDAAQSDAVGHDARPSAK